MHCAFPVLLNRVQKYATKYNFIYLQTAKLLQSAVQYFLTVEVDQTNYY